jgi:hypothetical protein
MKDGSSRSMMLESNQIKSNQIKSLWCVYVVSQNIVQQGFLADRYVVLFFNGRNKLGSVTTQVDGHTATYYTYDDESNRDHPG